MGNFFPSSLHSSKSCIVPHGGDDNCAGQIGFCIKEPILYFYVFHVISRIHFLHQKDFHVYVEDETRYSDHGEQGSPNQRALALF